MVAVYSNGHWPANFDGCTVEGTIVGFDGLPVVGFITFEPAPGLMLDYGALVTIVGRALNAVLDGNGHFSIFIPATDDPDINPRGWTYKVTQNWVGAIAPFAMEAPIGTTVDITEATPVPDALGVPVVRGPAGPASSVIMVQNVLPGGDGNVDLTDIFLRPALNLSELTSPPAARGSLGLGDAAVQPSSAFMSAGSGLVRANNLSDLFSAPTARTNLGLGSIATHDALEIPTGLLAASEDIVDHITLALAGHLYASPTPGNSTLTVATQRRYMVVTRSCFNNVHPTLNGNYDAGPCYTVGSVLTDANLIQMIRTPNTIGPLSNGTLVNLATVVLTPGTYTFGAFCERINGGSAADTVGLIVTQVFDIGPD